MNRIRRTVMGLGAAVATAMAAAGCGGSGSDVAQAEEVCDLFDRSSSYVDVFDPGNDTSSVAVRPARGVRAGTAELTYDACRTEGGTPGDVQYRVDVGLGVTRWSTDDLAAQRAAVEAEAEVFRPVRNEYLDRVSEEYEAFYASNPIGGVGPAGRLGELFVVENGRVLVVAVVDGLNRVGDEEPLTWLAAYALERLPEGSTELAWEER